MRYINLRFTYFTYLLTYFSESLYIGERLVWWLRDPLLYSAAVRLNSDIETSAPVDKH